MDYGHDVENVLLKEILELQQLIEQEKDKKTPAYLIKMYQNELKAKKESLKRITYYKPGNNQKTH
jgi:hypothetical protein